MEKTHFSCIDSGSANVNLLIFGVDEGRGSSPESSESPRLELTPRVRELEVFGVRGEERGLCLAVGVNFVGVTPSATITTINNDRGIVVCFLPFPGSESIVEGEHPGQALLGLAQQLQRPLLSKPNTP